MLEDRPIVQRSLIGFGAFSFVFTAAMAGTAFMISGGFGLGGDERPRPQSVQQYAIASETAWNDWTQPAYAATPAPIEQSAAPEAYEPTSYATAQDLDGDAQTARQARIAGRSEADILRDINRELDSYQAAYETEAAPVEEPAYYAPAPQDDIIAAKERAAAMEGYRPY